MNLILRKNAIPLHLAALAITASGAIFAEAAALPAALAATIFLMVSIYGIDALEDKSSLSVLFLVFSGVIGVALAALNGQSAFFAAGAIYALGLTYNHLPFLNLLPRKTLLAKNVWIAIGWSLLLFLSNPVIDSAFLAIVVICISQVFIGSVIRDMDDVGEDLETQTTTLAVVLSRTQLLSVLTFVNITFLAVVMQLSGEWALAMPFAYRQALLLYLAVFQGGQKWAFQSANLATCFAILLASGVYL